MVNTLTKKSFNVSAFPLGVVALEPFGFKPGFAVFPKRFWFPFKIAR